MIRVGVIGASGYTGSELLRLLIRHPEVRVEVVTSQTYAGRPVDEVIPSLRGILDLRLEGFDPDLVAGRVDVAFLALPHKVSMEFAPQLLERGVKVIDLSADYRLKDVETYEKWYGVKHTSPELLSEAVYGLPEIHGEEIRSARLVANPGCYPTGAILALAPLMREGWVEGEVIIDAKSGISGAGSKPSDRTHYPIRAENFEPYNVAAHRHIPEMEQELSWLAGKDVSVVFVPHLAPMSRGILSTIYVRLKEVVSIREIRGLYEDFYRDKPFVRVLREGELPATKRVYGSNLCDISIVSPPDSRTLIIISAIDNLVKGASGQAVQNMNLMFDLDERIGLDLPPVTP
mgnify:CR=1 FL=1